MRKNQRKRNDKHLDLARELKKTVPHESNDYKSGKETGGTGDQRKDRDHPDHSTVEINQNTSRGPGELRILAVNSGKTTSYYCGEKIENNGSNAAN